MNIGTLMEIENCQIRGQLSQDSLFLDEKPQDGYTWSGWRLTRKQTTSRPHTLWPEIWKDMSDPSKRKEKQKRSIEKPKLDSGRRLRGIYFIDPDDEEFKDIMKNVCRKLVAMPCKLQRDKYRETYRTVKKHKTNTLVLLKPMDL